MHFLSKLNHINRMKRIWPIKFKQGYYYVGSKYAFLFVIHIISNRGQLCRRYSDSLWTGQYRDLIPLAARFPHPSRPALRLTQPPVRRAPALFPWDKVAGAWR
jgi:hypothetical protein